MSECVFSRLYQLKNQAKAADGHATHVLPTTPEGATPGRSAPQRIIMLRNDVELIYRATTMTQARLGLGPSGCRAGQIPVGI